MINEMKVGDGVLWEGQAGKIESIKLVPPAGSVVMRIGHGSVGTDVPSALRYWLAYRESSAAFEEEAVE